MFNWSGLQSLILIDSYSGWCEMSTLSDLSSKSVIMKMKQHFAFHGIPSKLLKDNGPQFASREFKSFASEWSFEHVTSSHYFPQSNGFAENTGSSFTPKRSPFVRVKSSGVRQSKIYKWVLGKKGLREIVF